MQSPRNNTAAWTSVAVLFVAASLTVSMSTAQVQTSTTTTRGAGSKTVKVESGEVVYVSGNELMVKMADGSLRHFANVPESTKVTVDDQQLGIHELKVGMKLHRTITTTTVPETVKTVQTVTGKVWHVTPPNSVTLTLEDNTNQTFKIPKDQKFNVNGQMTDAFGLRKGMRVTATKIVEAPSQVISHETQLTGTMPPPPPAPPADAPILVVEEKAAPAPVQTAEATPAPTLPKTGSEVPLIGLLGLLSLSSSLALRAFRTK